MTRIDVDVEIESKLIEMEELARERVIPGLLGIARIGTAQGELVVRAWDTENDGPKMDYWIETLNIDRADARYHLSLPMFAEIE